MLLAVLAPQAATSVILQRGRLHVPVSGLTMPKYCVSVIAILALAHGLSAVGRAAARPAEAMLAIPAGTPARIDGSLKPGEWADADTLAIAIGPEWTVPVLLKHDRLTLYVAFSNLVQSTSERYPEILLDVAGDRAVEWQQDDWWLHASYSDCQSRGHIDDYSSCGQVHSGWSANNFPLKTGVVEFRVDLSAFGVRPDTSSAGPRLGLAFDVMDQRNEGRVSACWPATAQVLLPCSWSRAHLTPTPRASPSH